MTCLPPYVIPVIGVALLTVGRFGPDRMHVDTWRFMSKNGNNSPDATHKNSIGDQGAVFGSRQLRLHLASCVRGRHQRSITIDI